MFSLECHQIHGLNGTSHIFAHIDGALGELVDGCRNFLADGSVQLQTGDHTLPGGVAAHVAQVVTLQMVTKSDIWLVH